MVYWIKPCQKNVCHAFIKRRRGALCGVYRNLGYKDRTAVPTSCVKCPECVRLIKYNPFKHYILNHFDDHYLIITRYEIRGSNQTDWKMPRDAVVLELPGEYYFKPGLTEISFAKKELDHV